MGTTNTAACRLALGVLFCLAAAVALAAGDGLPAPPDYDAALEREILQNAERWRAPEREQQWRTAPQQDSGRMNLGFDSVYEEARQRAGAPTDLIGDRQTKPSSVFRMEF